MLKLYYSPGACSISPHIALREAGLPFELVRVYLREGKTTEGGGSYLDVNPKGYVPALALGDGQILTEGAAIVQYIADLAPDSGLAPPPGTFERVRLQEWLNFLATELHKGISPLHSPLASDEYKRAVKERVAARLGYLDASLTGKPFLLGNRFTVADGYAFYNLRSWLRATKGDLPGGLAEYYARIADRPTVRAVFQAEGL